MYLNKLKFNVLFIFIFLVNNFNIENDHLKKRIGVIGLDHSQNVGNNLLKFAMFIKLSELGHSPYIVGRKSKDHNISFILNVSNVKIINNFSEIKENDFDILMVNSDQTWRKWDDFFYDIAFLRFAKNWQKKKFVYGASLGYKNWRFRKIDEKIARYLLQNFSGISVREKGSISLIKKHLGFKAQFVLDPTLLINKSYYLDLIKNFKSEIIKQVNNEEYIFVYIIIKSTYLENYLKYVTEKLKTKTFYLTMNNTDQVKEFLYGITNCKAVITDSFHGTVFSIIFKKPFISFINIANDNSRFKSLDEIFNIKNRIFTLNSKPPISLLNQPLIINETRLISLRNISINYLKKNLEL